MKKIHIYLWALLLGSMTTVYAQTPEDIDKNKSFIPNSTPPAPEAFSMTKYGDVPVDEFNGKVNLNVPILQYNAGMLSLPVSVNYYGAGVKIADIPTQVGINWTLNAGGLISREIKGQPDESLDKLTLSLTQIMNLNKEDCSVEAQQLRAIIDNKNIDKENDIFNFNFLGYSGSFFLNDSFDPVLTKNDQELRIEIFGSDPDKSKRLREGKTFLITTPDGVKFYFGGVNASEESALMVRNNGNPDLDAVGGITSFYLYKIEHPLNGSILLEYETTVPHNVPINTNYFKVKKIIDPFAESHSNNSFYSCPGLPETSESVTSGFTLTQQYIVNEKKVKKIYSPDTEDYILFNRDFYNSAMNFKKVLKSIEYYKGNSIYNKVNFDYIGLVPLNIHRFFLSKIDFNNQITGLDNKRETYVFEYNEPNTLPTLNSYSKDILGYFNNKSNLYLYPHFSNDSQTNSPDRTSDFFYASKGVLKKVVYPTKGYSEFEYESQPFIEPKYDNYHIETYFNGTGGLDGEGSFSNGVYQKLHDEIPGVHISNQGVHTVESLGPIFRDQTVSVILSVSNENEENINAKPFKAKVKITEKDQLGNVVSVLQKESVESISFLYQFKKSYNYKVELDLIPSIDASPYHSSTGYVSFQLHAGYHAPNGYGVRLKRVKNYSLGTSNPEIKRYYYKPYHQLNDLGADSFQFANVERNGGYLVICQGSDDYGGLGTLGISAVRIPVVTKTINSTPDFLDNTLFGNFREYSCVTVGYGTEEEPFKNGGLEKTFALGVPLSSVRLEPKSINNFLGEYALSFEDQISYSNPNPLNGQLIKEKVFSNVGSNLKKIKEISYEYANLIEYQKINLKGNKLLSDISVFCNQSGGSNGRVLSNYWLSYFYTNSHGFKKIAEKEITYIDPVPATLVAHVPSEVEDPNAFPTQDQLEASYKKVTTTQTYEYGALRGMPTKITMTNSNGELQINENVYVNQYGTLTGLNTAQTNAYAALLAQNNVASPIETKQSDNLGVLNKKRTTYKVLSGNKVVPETIQTAKENFDLEERAVFEQYDSKGNPTIMSLTGGVKIKYLYNTQNQVIAKIENFTGTLDANTNSIGDITAFRNQFPNAMVSVFEYDPITNLLVRMYDPNGKKMTYEYDALHRLKLIKDNDNNVIKEFDQNFKN